MKIIVFIAYIELHQYLNNAGADWWFTANACFPKLVHMLQHHNVQQVSISILYLLKTNQSEQGTSFSPFKNKTKDHKIKTKKPNHTANSTHIDQLKCECYLWLWLPLQQKEHHGDRISRDLYTTVLEKLSAVTYAWNNWSLTSAAVWIAPSVSQGNMQSDEQCYLEYA